MMYNTQPTYQYKGYLYTPTEDVEPEECTKIFHDVIAPDGKRIHLHWSPYSTPTEAEFQIWIDLGMPGRVEYGNSSFNLCSKSLHELHMGTKDNTPGVLPLRYTNGEV